MRTSKIWRLSTVAAQLMTLLLLSGCLGGRGTGTPTKFSDVAPADAVKIVDVPLARQKFATAAALGEAVNSLRLVEVFRRGEQERNRPPEYRIFDVQKGSAYEMLGLQNADLLQAAGDYVIFDAESFRVYTLQVLPKVDSGSIRVVRAGVPMVLTYKITQ